MQKERHFYLPKEFAKRFRLSRSFVYLMIREGELKALKIKGVYRIPRAEYCRYCMCSNGCKPCTWSRS